jgi:uncharacterized protein (DUF2267 family)
MSAGFAVFDHTVELTNIWLKEVAAALGCEGERARAYHALRAVLHALRDRLPPEEVADLGAQLPMLVRGFYYEGWRPAGKPLRERKPEQFLAHVASALPQETLLDAEDVARAVFQVLSRHVTGGEIDDVKASLPQALRPLWS